MQRNMMKTVESVKGKNLIPTAYDLTATEMQTIYDLFTTDPFEAISTTFDYGFVLGARAQKAGKLDSPTRSASEEKMAYVDLVNKAMKECNDIDTLDLVWRILAKSETSGK